MPDGKHLTDAQIGATAEKAGLEFAALKAVALVEANGSGFLPDGRPKILFEGHVFWRELKKQGLDPAKSLPAYADILYPKWDKAKYKGGAAEYRRLEKAERLGVMAARKSASWGMFQIMGFNHALCGFRFLADFLTAMYESEAAHLKAALAFIKSAGLLPALKKKDWAAFAKGYNGPGYAQNRYDQKLTQAYQAALKG